MDRNDRKESQRALNDISARNVPIEPERIIRFIRKIKKKKTS